MVKMSIPVYFLMVALCGSIQTASETSPENFIKHDANDNSALPSIASTKSHPNSTPASTNFPNTTTAAPTTTTEAPTTTTEAPEPIVPVYFNITNNDAFCIMIDGDFYFNVTYNAYNNTSQQAIIEVPKPGRDDAKVDGNCTEPDTQWISIAWGNTIPKNTITFLFNKTTDGLHWNVASVRSVIAFNEASFPNATEPGTVVHSTFEYYFEPRNVPYNQSYNCHTPLFGKNGTSKTGNETYLGPLEFEAKEVQIQAFNFVTRTRDFVKAVYCRADKTTDVLPTVVGCILSVATIFVVCAYVCGPKRTSSGYEEI